MGIGPRFALALGLATGGAAPAAADPLSAHRGVSRLLVLSAPDAADRRLTAQRAALAAVRPDLGERDLVVVEAVGGGPDAVAVRRRLGLPSDAFRVVLVGKDGGAKITSAEPIPPGRLFATIDAMPMRRDEMGRR